MTADPDIAAGEPEADESVADLLERLARDVAALVLYESRLAAARHERELRRAARDFVVLFGAAAAFLMVFALLNAAALLWLSTEMAPWRAALALAAGWAVFGAVLALWLRARARRLTALGPETLEEARERAEQAVRETIERLAPALAKEMALAAVPSAGDVVELGEELVESVDELVDSVTEGLPGGGVVNQVWDVVLAPGRLGVRVATTVLRRGEPGGSGEVT